MPSPGASEKVLAAFGRLSHAYSLFIKDQPFGKSCRKCHAFYKSKNELFLGDIMLYPAINNDILSLLLWGFPKSKAVRAMMYHELFELLKRGKIEDFVSTLQKMDAAKLISSGTKRRLSVYKKQESSLSELCSIFVSEVCLSSGEPLMAASFAIQLLEMGTSLDRPSLELLILNLTLGSLLEPSFTAYTITKLIDLHGVDNVSFNVLLDALLCMLHEPHIPFYANYIYDNIKDKLLSHERYSEIALQVLRANMDKGNLCRATDIWKELQNYSPATMSNEAALLNSLLERLVDEDLGWAAEFSEDIPHDLQRHPKVIDTLLLVYGKSPDKQAEFAELSKCLEAPLSRRSLSSLFSSFLHQNNEEASDKLLKAIFKTPSGLSLHDFGALIEKLLRQNKVQQSVEMCFKNDVSVSKIGYIHVLEHYLYLPEAHGDREIFLKTFCRQFKKLSTLDPAYYLFTSKIFGYFTTKINNSLSRTLFIFKGLTALNKKESRFDFEKVLLPNQFNDFIVIDNHNRISCINAIYRQAIKQQDQVNIEWCLKELRSLGVPMSDILAHYLKVPSKELLA